MSECSFNQLSEDTLLKNFSTIQRKTQMYLNMEHEAYGLTWAQVPFILIACEAQALPQNRYADLLDMNKSTVTKTVARLEADGFLMRRQNADDCRSYDILPTEKAFEIYPILRKKGNEWVLKITEDMTPIERAIYMELTAKVAQKAVEYTENRKD